MREQIIQRALELFLTKGVLQTSLIDIAKSLDLSKGAIYHYFKNKEDLLFATFDLITSGMVAYIEPLESGMTLEEAFDFLLEVMVAQEGLEVAGQYEFILYCSRQHPDLKAQLVAMTDRFNKAMSAMLESGIEAGIYKKDLDVSLVLLKISVFFEGTLFLNHVYQPVGLKKMVPKLFTDLLNEIRS